MPQICNYAGNAGLICSADNHPERDLVRVKLLQDTVCRPKDCGTAVALPVIRLSCKKDR